METGILRSCSGPIYLWAFGLNQQAHTDCLKHLVSSGLLQTLSRPRHRPQAGLQRTSTRPSVEQSEPLLTFLEQAQDLESEAATLAEATL
eukprot:g27318.t1